MSFAQSERHALCELLLQVGPGRPTLCDGWETQDLAAHLWVREADPIAAPGMFLPRFAALTDRRMADVLDRWSYDELVGRIHDGPPRWSVFALPGLDAAGNGIEYFVHVEDVRRAAADDVAPRELPSDVEDWLWQRLRRTGRLFFRHVAVGLILEDVRTGEQLRVRPGGETVTLVGRPSELTLYAFGRTAVADVEAIGTPDALATLAQTSLGV